jgi:DNA-binding response OmpR family regulator/two-component sensor histidine kinase
MEDAEDENEDFIPDLDKINNSGKHLLGLINDILDLSKVESGKMELYIEEFDLSKIMSEIESTIKPLVEKNNNALTIEIDSNLKTMTADITKIRQIMLNLLSNSSKFTNDGAITIHVSNSASMDNAVDFVIADTGIGMSQDQVEKVFMPFTQADEKTTRKFGGTGLGLTITKMFAEMMGGDINLTSEEGKGTTFTVTIPQVVVDKKKQNIEIITDVVHENDYTILVIDDDDNAQDMMKKFLEKQNFLILQAKTGEDGLKLAAEHMPDVITLDVMMPEMDGWEVLAALQGNERTKNIPVIMLTMADEPDLGYSLGATDYLTKPVNWTELSTILNNHQIQSDSQSILIVEDDETTRDMLRKSLEKNDFKVRSAVNGKEALEKVSETKPGLIILDLMMPEMDGFEFAERLRENKEWLDIPVVVITAKDLTKDDHSRLKGNVEAIMQKGSYSKNDLMSEIGERIKKLQVRS